MQRDIVVKGRSLGGTSDLTLLAPIKPGFADSLESVSYKTRAKRVLEALHGSRVASHEHALVRLLSDAVERVGVIHSVRVAVVEPEDKILLAVTFDGSWESYIRTLWDKVGPLLDLIFCSTVDYVTAHDHSFDEWLGWARRVQIETGFFYGPPDATARDALYHRRIERTRQRLPLGEMANAQLLEIRSVTPSAEEAVERVLRAMPSQDPDDPPSTPTWERMGYERFRNGFQALSVLYRLTEYFRPGTPDGVVLRVAALNLLREFVDMWNAGLGKDDFAEARWEGGVKGAGEGRFKRQLDWLLPEHIRPVYTARPTPPFTAFPPETASDVQGGILSPYVGVTHGAVLLIALDGAAGAEAFLSRLQGKVASEATAGTHAVLRNVAFTPAGLRACGLSDDELDLFSEEFRQGMAERAGLLGDVRHNHPRRWRLPPVRDGMAPARSRAHVDMGAVHAVLQLRCMDESAPDDVVDVEDAKHPLHEEVGGWASLADHGIHVLAFESLKRQFRVREDGTKTAAEHFGYADGDSEPSFTQDIPEGQRMHLGEVLVGHDNAADRAPDEADPSLPPDIRARLWWQKNGSYLVVRKYRQFPKRLSARVADAVRRMTGAAHYDPTRPEHQAYEELVYAKLMGRRRDGQPLVDPRTPGSLNDFTYADDVTGARCPLHAHVRRANPRMPKEAMPRAPRLMRRSMPYGPYPDPEGPEDDRGLVFMAYNASLGEQFEVIQRWLVGANSTGSTSGESCPIVGVAESGVPRHARFEYGDQKVACVALEPQTPLFDDSEPVTRLDWGLYLFAPSLAGLDRLWDLAYAATLSARAARPVPWSVARGREIIQQLRDLEHTGSKEAAVAAWKAAIEDPEAIDRMESAALWAAIRADFGGALRTPYGILVASRELVSRIYLDQEQRYSVCGQMDRMRNSIGEIALGEDAGPRYDEAAGPVNKRIMSLDRDEVFALARAAADRRLDAIRDEAVRHAEKGGELDFDVAFDAREVVDEVLATLSEAWFGIQDSKHFRRGSVDWSWTEGSPPIYPGQFTALSRYMFQPNPGVMPQELGQRYGRALTAAMLEFVKEHRPSGVPRNRDGEPAPIAEAIFKHPTLGHSDEFVAKTMVGVLMGFTPTIIGAILNVLREWARDGSFWRLRASCAGQAVGGYDEAYGLLHGAMQDASRMRPMPQIGWRTARKPDRLGTGQCAVDVAAGEKVVLGMVSGTQQSLEDRQDDGRLMFGGRRTPEKPHPTHACPGYEAGIAAMLGTLAAMLTRKEELRQGLGPLSFDMRGPTSETAPAEKAEWMRVLEKVRAAGDDLALLGAERVHLRKMDMAAGGDEFSRIAKQLLVHEKSAKPKGLVMAWGDSWLDFAVKLPFYFQDYDLMNSLSDLGYQVNEGRLDKEDEFCNYRKWLLIETMAEQVYIPDPDRPGKTREGRFLAYLRGKLAAPVKPRAILLSGGGNDSVGLTLKGLLKQANPAAPVDRQALELHVAKLKASYETVVDAIRSVLASTNNAALPILVHGYDYPIPFVKRGWPFDDAFNNRQAAWLQKPLIDKGYRDPNDPDFVDVATGKKAMHEIIQAFNDMLSDELPKGRPNVHYVKLLGTLQEYWDGDEKPGWHNNLHPNKSGFVELGKVLAQAIEKHAATPAPLP